MLTDQKILIKGFNNPAFQHITKKKMNPNERSNDAETSLESQPRKKPNLEEIINSPGLQHIAEEMFLNLDFKDIMACTQINKSCKEIVENPIFWLKKWRLQRGLSKKNHEDWIKAVQITKNTTLNKNVQAYVEKIIEIGHFVDVPCYIDSKVVSEFSNGISFDQAFKEGKAGILQLLAVIVWTCETCGKSFSRFSRSEENLKIHTHTSQVNSHNGQKDHKCEYCGKSFSHAHTLKNHINKNVCKYESYST